MADKIDSHHHLWHYSESEYAWIGPNMTAIRRDFLPADIHRELQRCGLQGCVTVQARQNREETDTLLRYAAENNFIRGVVGWVPLTSPDLDGELNRLQGEKKLKGVRHIVHDEADDFYILRDDFNAGIRKLAGTGLVYDILIFEKHLPQTIEFVDKHPKQIFVVDHIAKPRIRDGAISPWRTRLQDLARRPNVYCKLSGVVTEASWTEWRNQKVGDYIDVALEAFGARRMMFGSDWPVLLVAASYAEWWQTVEQMVASLSTDEQARILGGTAIEVYRL